MVSGLAQWAMHWPDQVPDLVLAQVGVWQQILLHWANLAATVLLVLKLQELPQRC
jgi:hypothetical protein